MLQNFGLTRRGFLMLTAGAALKMPISPLDSGRNLAYHFYILVM